MCRSLLSMEPLLEAAKATKNPGLLVKAYRSASLLSQTRLAGLMGMPLRRLMRIEAGEITDLLLSEVAAFQRILGLPSSVWGPGDTTTPTRREDEC